MKERELERERDRDREREMMGFLLCVCYNGVVLKPTLRKEEIFNFG